jgi:hypothetical protein
VSDRGLQTSDRDQTILWSKEKAPWLAVCACVMLRATSGESRAYQAGTMLKSSVIADIGMIHPCTYVTQPLIHWSKHFGRISHMRTLRSTSKYELSRGMS